MIWVESMEKCKTKVLTVKVTYDIDIKRFDIPYNSTYYDLKNLVSSLDFLFNSTVNLRVANKSVRVMPLAHTLNGVYEFSYYC